MSRTITSTNNGAKSVGKRRPEPAVKPVSPETVVVQKIDMPVTLRLKLGSLVTHCEEMLGPKGHTFDQHAIAGLIQDPEVRLFMEETGKMGILPVKR